ncbi:U-box domain-containing protein [Vigna angularis]|uniref:U-box domain-containing protein n=1 Tax=Phaseolus angularis TaxID=3914 RepID=A0A8T0KDS4_PHAAN|nr:U-box domain-containing protein [Vigna angularis]
MEIQQSLKLTIHKKWPSSPKKTSKDSEPINTTATPKLKWKKIFFHTKTKPKIQTPPDEFLCPVSRSLMFDPVIVSSGHSFERSSVEACKNLNFTPQLPDGTTPDFSTLIPNLALKSAILKWKKVQVLKWLSVHSVLVKGQAITSIEEWQWGE